MSPSNYFLPMDVTWTPPSWDQYLRLVSDQPAKAHLWYSDLPPQRKQIYRPVRGVMIPCGWNYSFRPKWEAEQQEPDLSLLHTFNPVNWAPETTAWYTFTFWGPTAYSRSQTPIFTGSRGASAPYLTIWTGDLTIPGSLIGGSLLLYESEFGEARLSIEIPGVLEDDYPFTAWDPFTTQFNGWYIRISSAAPVPDPQQVWFEANELTTDLLTAPVAPADALDSYTPTIENLGNFKYPLGWQPWPEAQDMQDYFGEDGYNFLVLRTRGQALHFTEWGVIP